MKFDGNVDLLGNSLKAKNATFTGDIAANTVTATAFIGSGAKLTGLPMAKGDCPAGQLVRGIAPDGSLRCVAALTGSSLPADGLASVSNGLLTNQFSETWAAKDLPLFIPDNTGIAATSTITLPSLGAIQAIEVNVKVSNSDLASLRLVLLPPNDKKTGLVLCDPCGATDAKALDTAFSTKTPIKSGDLKAWLGKDPQGTWQLKALDSKWCVLQAQGNQGICDGPKKRDGVIAGFSLRLKLLSSKKAGFTGLLQLALLSKPPEACRMGLRGSLFYDVSDNSVRYCDGKVWRALSNACGNGKMELGEECDDGNNTSGDGCSSACVVGRGASASDPARSCKALFAVAKSIGNGSYWLDIDGPGAGKAAKFDCAMSSHGGGWTRVYAESGATSAGWSTAKLTSAKVGGVSTAVHGVFGKNVLLSKKVSLAGLAHSEVRVGGRFFAIDSWDGESAKASLDGTTVFRRAKVYNKTGGGNWTTRSFSPGPWAGSSIDGFWDLWLAASANAHTANTVQVTLTSTIDQDTSDESWAADRVSIWVR